MQTLEAVTEGCLLRIVSKLFTYILNNRRIEWTEMETNCQKNKRISGPAIQQQTTFLPSYRLSKKAWHKGKRKYMLISWIILKPSIESIEAVCGYA